MDNERQIAKQEFDKHPMFHNSPIAWTAWKMAFQLGIEHQQKLHKAGVMYQLPLSESFVAWCKETKRNGGVIIGSSIREFFSWYEAKNLEMISGNCT